jgi:hypothetical protein
MGAKTLTEAVNASSTIYIWWWCKRYSMVGSDKRGVIVAWIIAAIIYAVTKNEVATGYLVLGAFLPITWYIVVLAPVTFLYNRRIKKIADEYNVPFDRVQGVSYQVYFNEAIKDF